MALQGTIDSFPVMDVLGLLAASSKTGVLQLTGDRGDGSLWLREGSIIAGDVRDHTTATAADVVFEFLRFEAAAFEFIGDDAPVAQEFDASVAETIEAAQQMLGEWEAVCEVVPDTSHRVTLVAELDAPEVTLSAAEWSLIAAAASGPPVTEVLERVGLGEFEGCRRLAGLLGRGILETAEPTSNDAGTDGAAIKPDVVSHDVGESESDPAPGNGAVPTFGDTAVESTSGGDPAGSVAAAEAGALGDTTFDETAVSARFGESTDISDPVHFEAEAGYFDDDATPEATAFEGGPTGSPLGGSSAEDPATTGVFPDHFPIDDLVGSEESVSFDTPPGMTANGPSNAAFSAEPAAPQYGDAPRFAGEGFPFGGTSETGDGGGGVQPFDGAEASEVVGESNGSEPSDDVLAQIGRLSPKAAEAIAAALGDGEHG